MEPVLGAKSVWANATVAVLFLIGLICCCGVPIGMVIGKWIWE